MLNDRELATVLAALRYWQRTVLDNERSGLPPEWDVATNGTLGMTPLKAYQVDALCERLNRPRPAAIDTLVAYANAAPATDPGEGYWADLDAAFECGMGAEQYEAAARIRAALKALGIDAPTGVILCEGCSQPAGGGEHDPDCTLAADDDDDDSEPECPHCGETYSMNWVASVQTCPNCNGLIERPEGVGA